MLATERRTLTDAFSTFSRVSAQLETSYRDLERQIAGLTAELGEARRTQSELIDALPGGVVVLGADGRIRECNPAARELLGDSLIGALWESVAARVLQSASRLGREYALPSGRRVTGAERALAAIGGGPRVRRGNPGKKPPP